MKLYCFIEKDILLNSDNGKLDKYISNHQENIAGNLVNNKKKVVFFNSSFSIDKASLNYKLIFKIMLVNIALFAIKVAISYKFLSSNFISIKIFSKNLDLVYLFGHNIIYFKFFYLFLSLYFIIFITQKIFIFYSKFNLRKENLNYAKNDEKIYVGKYNDEKFYVDIKGLYQNLMITGSIGSGKTSSAISNILDGLIKNKLSGLIIDVKGNFYDRVLNIAKKYNFENKIIKISLDSNFLYNPLLNENISNFEKSQDIKKILNEISNSNESEPFWLDKASSYIQDFLNFMDFYECTKNFYELHKLVNNEEYLFEKIEEIKENVLKNKYDEEKLFILNTSINNIKYEYLKLDERTIGIIRAEITRITSVFVNDYEIYNKFCKGINALNFNSNIYVLSLNFGKYRNLTKVISTYLKFEFQRFVLMNGNRNTFFLADEYQEIANAEDAHFFSLSREYNCINVISMQSYTSLRNAIRNDNASNVIIQNFINKIWFRNDDIYTIEQIIKYGGKILKENKGTSYTQNGQNTRYNAFTNNFKNYKSGISKSLTYNLKEDYKFNEKMFSLDLNTFEAVCTFSDGNKVKLYEKVLFKRWGSDDENKT